MLNIIRLNYLRRLEKHDEDVYLEYYTGKGFHINYSCLQVLRKTHKLVIKGISNEHKKRCMLIKKPVVI
jgi:hypothetical protein